MNPQRIGNYQVLGELGRGAMGVVYHALDPAIGRPVAIKVIRIDAGASPEAGAELRHRLVREASAAGNLSHPGIVTVHQLGEDISDIFVVMEFVSGMSLERMLASNPRPDPRHATEILRQAADALDYAHSRGVVHRDIKPANILLREDGCVKVADFGIAKMTQSTTQGMTAMGTSIGSPAYMSPEQVRSEPVDGRSDQFSLAVVAYQMLVGQLPFAAETAHAVMFQIVGSDPFQRGVPLAPPIAGVLARALAKDPNQRFNTCSQFIHELRLAAGIESAARGEPTGSSTVTPTLPQPALIAPPAQKRKSPLLIIGLLVVLAALGAGSILLLKHGSAPGIATPETAAALIKAVYENRIDDAKGLIAKGTDVNAANTDGTTALMQAAEGSGYLSNNGPAVTMLLDQNAAIDLQDKRGRTALYLAVSEGKDDAVRLLLAHKADPNHKAADGSTPLIAAVQFGHLPATNSLLDRGADVEAANADGTTPLMIASEGTGYMPNNTPLVEALLAKNPKIDKQDGRGRTALYRAASEGKADAARLLLDKKANPNQQAADGSTPLLEAVTFGKQQVMQLLLERGAEVERADASGNTPLMIAAEGTGYTPNNAPLVAALLAANAKIDAQDSRGRSPLYRASAEGKEDAIRLLLDKKANPNLKANDGSAALLEAVTFNKRGAAELLLDRGADVNLADSNGSTALMVVAEGNGYIKSPGELMTLLLAHGAKKDLTDSRGRTALARATEAKNTDAIAILNKGAVLKK